MVNKSLSNNQNVFLSMAFMSTRYDGGLADMFLVHAYVTFCHESTMLKIPVVTVEMATLDLFIIFLQR